MCTEEERERLIELHEQLRARVGQVGERHSSYPLANLTVTWLEQFPVPAWHTLYV
jgi:hypothetical protein